MLTKIQFYSLDEAFEKLTKALRDKTKIRREQNLLLDKNYKIMHPVIVEWMRYTNAQIIKDLNKKYINKSFQKAEAGKIVTNLTDWGELEKEGVRMVKPASLEIFESGGNEAFKVAGIEGAFDIVNVDAVNIVNEICSKDVKEVLDNTKKAINTLIKMGIEEGQAMAKIAKQIRPLVGLTERQALAVVNYRDKLLAKYPKYSVAKLDKMAKKYSDKLHKYRAVMIARTETARAQNEGTLKGYKDLGYKKVEWSANADACQDCDALNGHTFTLEEASGMMPLHPNCFVDAKVPIYTSKGWRRITDIKIGDLVLTHKGRFRKVTFLHRIPKQSVEVVKISIKRKTMTVTDNHPILIDNKWVEAKDIKVGDKIYLLASQCKRCKKLIPYYKKYCSFHCCSKDITDRQWANPEHRINISNKSRAQMYREYENGTLDRFEITKKANEKVRQLILKNEFVFQQDWVRDKIREKTNLPHHNKANSERMKKNNPMYIPVVVEKAKESARKFYLKHPEKHPNYIMAQKGFISGLEKKYKDILDNLDISYKRQYPIKSYFVDFAIPDLKMAIEIDGAYWHKDKEKDLLRQQNIEKEGWTVIRFKEKEINKNIEEVKSETKRLIMNHKGEYNFIPLEVKSVEKWKLRKPKMLYNLSVEEDESFIASGFVVHNCRCAWISVIEGIKPKLE